MRRLVLLLVLLASTLGFAGCGNGGSTSSPEESKKRQAETQANMDQGMKAMKAMKATAKPKSR